MFQKIFVGARVVFIDRIIPYKREKLGQSFESLWEHFDDRYSLLFSAIIYYSAVQDLTTDKPLSTALQDKLKSLGWQRMFGACLIVFERLPYFSDL